MRLVEHMLHGRHGVDLVGCDACGITATADLAASWLHLGPLILTDTPASLVEGFDFCSLECANRRVTILAETEPASAGTMQARG